MLKALRYSVIIVVFGLAGLIVLLSSPVAQSGNSSRGAAPITGPTATIYPFTAYTAISRAELVSYANDHIGEHVHLMVKIFNVIDGDTFQAYLLDSTDAIVIRMRTPHKRLYKDDQIEIYGVVAGYASGTNSFGATIKQPELDDARLN